MRRAVVQDQRHRIAPPMRGAYGFKLIPPFPVRKRPIEILDSKVDLDHTTASMMYKTRELLSSHRSALLLLHKAKWQSAWVI